MSQEPGKRPEPKRRRGMTAAWDRLYDWFLRGADPRADESREPGTGSAPAPGDGERKVEARSRPARGRAAVVCLATIAALGVVGADGVDARRRKPKLPSEQVFCGQTIDHSLRVANNLFDCPDDGLVIGAPNIIIDLAGHRIDGTGGSGDVGIDNTAGHGGVKVRNGVVTGFENGVRLAGAKGNVIAWLHMLDNALNGIRLELSSEDNTVKASTAAGNGFDGISLNGSSGNTLRSNRALSNSTGFGVRSSSNSNTLESNTAWGNDFGFSVSSSDNVVLGNSASNNDTHGFFSSGSSDNNTFRGNSATGNGSIGFFLSSGPSDYTLKANTATGNAVGGIFLSSTSGTTLKANTAKGNGGNGIAIGASTSTTADGNLASGNDADGISVAGGSGNVLKNNKAHRNGSNGIASNTSALTLKDNRANGNGFLGGPPDADGMGLGIDVPADTTNSGNKAKDNDDPNECEAADVTSCHVP
jgi:parallel beta-helix repeat protein